MRHLGRILCQSIKKYVKDLCFLRLPRSNALQFAEICFGGRFNVNSVKSQYSRSLQTYNLIVAFEKFTGNGGGDVDVDADDAKKAIKVLGERISGARRAGHAVGKLTATIVNEWYEKGFYKIFNER